MYPLPGLVMLADQGGRVIKLNVDKNRHVSQIRRRISDAMSASTDICSSVLLFRLSYIYDKLGYLYSPVYKR